jgi:hypothetical protein
VTAERGDDPAHHVLPAAWEFEIVGLNVRANCSPGHQRWVFRYLRSLALGKVDRL